MFCVSLNKIKSIPLSVFIRKVESKILNTEQLGFSLKIIFYEYLI